MADTLVGTDAERPVTRPGLVILIVVIGVVMAAVDTTIVILALPSMERSLHISLSSQYDRASQASLLQQGWAATPQATPGGDDCTAGLLTVTDATTSPAPNPLGAQIC